MVKINKTNEQIYNTYISEKDDFVMSIPTKDSNTILVTSDKDVSQVDKIASGMLLSSIQKYDSNKQLYSAYTTDDTSADEITPSDLDDLAVGLQSNLDNILKVNKIVRKYIITDDIIGKTQEAIETNVNTNIKLSYDDFSDKKIKTKKLETAKATIKQFNKQINLKNLIKECIPLTFAEGTYIAILRFDKAQSTYVVDHYPLGLVSISDYKFGGEPIVELNITQLKNKLKKTYKKNRKNQAIYFKNIEDDIKNNYPAEVYKAYKDGETYCRLDTKYTGVVRIGNLGRKYGVSPILRALKSAMMLENYENSDYVNTKAKAKKIIFQKLRKETMGKDYTNTGIKFTVKAHDDLMSAWQNKTVVYTAIPQVEALSYVEPTVEDTNADKINAYRSKEMTTLGIGFADSNVSNFSVANISLDQLMKTINSISEQLQEVVQTWYEILFENEKIDKIYLPELQILDSEAMDFEIKKDLAKTLYTIFNGSAETSLELLGINVNDEKAKRQAENENGYNEIFKCRQTAYTSSGSGEVNDNTDTTNGRTPSNDDKDKQSYDDNYNQVGR